MTGSEAIEAIQFDLKILTTPTQIKNRGGKK